MSTNFILGILFFIGACLVMGVRKAYFAVPLSELKKRRMLGEDISQPFMESLSYGTALRSLLWLKMGICLAISFALLSTALTLWLDIIVIALAVYYLFSFLPSSRISKLDYRLTSVAAPVLNWILQRTSRHLNKLSSPLQKHYRLPVLPIFDNQDLLALIKKLGRSHDHRIDPDLLVNLERSFILDERRISDLMTPAKKVKKLLRSDVIGPILINELHESLEGIAVVREEPKGEIIGTLSFADLSIKSQGVVGSHMTREVYYLPSDAPSLAVVKAFYQTSSSFFIVIDNLGKFVGVISLDKVLKQLTGPLDSYKQADYTSPDTVAKRDEEMIEYTPEDENTKQSG
ncbi:MAG TPA: CBS domain-containing protein [Candidatus Saccharimonadales bacterium]|nr:CBS domain-containing protein [Candidatus Saccharimonadales bacterium]